MNGRYGIGREKEQGVGKGYPIGYFLAESNWGRGATEAVSLLIRYLFTEADVNRIQAEVMPRNEASKKVLLKNGFIKEGTLWSGKGIVDLEIYSM